nr:MAG TPA: SH3 domain protein [Caudoviricetes sp.]
MANVTGKTTASALNLRSGAGTSTPVIGSIPKGTSVTITQQSNGWGKTTYGGKTGWISMKYVSLTSGSAAKTSPKSTDTKVSDREKGITDAKIAAELEKFRTTSVNSGKVYKGSMRLFGLPSQYPSYQDIPVNSVNASLGRTFINNMLIDAPILTLIPGKPSYLPGAKDKVSTAQTLISSANDSFGELNALATNLAATGQRYYDFQQDYLEYIKYVNILCRTAAAFLELQDYEIDGVKLTQYDWKNYRFTASNYSSLASNAVSSTKDSIDSIVDKIKKFGTDAVDAVFGKSPTDSIKDAYLSTFSKKDKNGKDVKLTDADKEKAYKDFAQKYANSSSILFDDQDDIDENLLSAMDGSLLNMNFVQFYIDASGGMSESASNSTTESKIQSALDTGSDLVKEISFLTNSSGIGDTDVAENATKMFDNMTTSLISSTSMAGSLGNVMSRIISAGTYVVKGENMIFPEIYQRSDYGKSYSININLKAIYGNRFSLYMDTIVPLMHLLALVLPKQGSANTYSSPFLVRMHLPGVCNCNLGIVEGLSIEKNPSGDALSYDGLPLEYRVSLNIKDLYSDLMMTPSSAPMMFLTNSSLIDYLAVTCGLDVTAPQLDKKIQMYTDVITSAAKDIPNNVFSILDNAVQSFIIPKVMIGS